MFRWMGMYICTDTWTWVWGGWIWWAKCYRSAHWFWKYTELETKGYVGVGKKMPKRTDDRKKAWNVILRYRFRIIQPLPTPNLALVLNSYLKSSFISHRDQRAFFWNHTVLNVAESRCYRSEPVSLSPKGTQTADPATELFLYFQTHVQTTCLSKAPRYTLCSILDT